MKQTIIIHGSPEKEDFFNQNTPSPSNQCWIPWIQKQLSLQDQICQAPEFPQSYDPLYKEWEKAFEQFELNYESILVGHSCGGGFLLRYLSEHPDIKPLKVILVAPWLDPEKEFSTDFFNFKIDTDLSKRTEVHVFISSDDFASVQTSLKTIENELSDIVYHRFSNKGHFDDFTENSKEFPELLEVILK
jgi:predicted alpha/beta hydrolase family esterase